MLYHRAQTRLPRGPAHLPEGGSSEGIRRDAEALSVDLAENPVAFDPSRSTPRGYWRFAAEYYLAGEAARQAFPALWTPILQLYAQSLELALKAFLLKRGASLEDVERMRTQAGRGC